MMYLKLINISNLPVCFLLSGYAGTDVDYVSWAEKRCMQALHTYTLGPLISLTMSVCPLPQEEQRNEES